MRRGCHNGCACSHQRCARNVAISVFCIFKIHFFSTGDRRRDIVFRVRGPFTRLQRREQLKSVQAGGPVELSFRNASAQSRRLYWIDQTGDRKFIGVVAPGNMLRRPPWVMPGW